MQINVHEGGMTYAIVERLSCLACTRGSTHKLHSDTVQIEGSFYLRLLPTVSSCLKPSCHDRMHCQIAPLKVKDSWKRTVAACRETRNMPILSYPLGDVEERSMHTPSPIQVCFRTTILRHPSLFHVQQDLGFNFG